MLLTKVVMFSFTVVVAKNLGQHRHKSHLVSHLTHLLRPNNNFFSELSRNAEKVINGIFESLRLSQVFSKEPKIKVIIKMLHNLNDMSHNFFELYDALRNASVAAVDNRPISQIRLNEFIIRILNEKEVNMNNATKESSEKNQSINSKESSEFANSKEFKEFIGGFLKKLRSLTVNDLYDKMNENENAEYELDQSGYGKLDIWEPSIEDTDMPNVTSRRIFKGIKTSIVSYPFVVSIHILNEFMCAGSIISKDLIITAASCLQIHYNNRFFRENPKTTFVRVGSDWTNRRGELVPVLGIFFHPQYNPKTLHHNLALIRLERTLHWQTHKNTKIRRILLDRGEGNLAANTDGIKILGWGAKKPDQIVYEFEKLDYAILNIYHVEECKEVYSKEFVTQNNFCAGFLSKGGGACNRDVGGPAIVNNLLMGVVSFGPPVCGARNAPTVFSRVGHYINWIKRVMAMRPPVYGVPTTSARMDKFLIYYNTASPSTYPHMHPINEFLTTAFIDPIMDRRRRADHAVYSVASQIKLSFCTWCSACNIGIMLLQRIILFCIVMDEMEFKPFYETYRKISFALSVGMMYPNPNNEKRRLIAMIFIIGTITPVGSLAVIDMYRCYLEKDFVNIVRHSTVLGPFLLAFFKIVLMYLKRSEAKQIIDEITSDYLLLNNRNQKYKNLGKVAIRNSQIYSETGWVLLVSSCVMTYPIMAIVLTTYNFLFIEDPVKYMVHDMYLPNLEPEARFKSPFFDFFFIYMCYCVTLYIVSFIGYDGLFGLSINHACLKMDCYCAALEDAMRSDSMEVYSKVVCVIQDQCKMFEFVNWIQDTFNIWLGVIFVATIAQICTSLYHITEGTGFDMMYLIFLGGAVAHIYVPCRYAAKLKEMSEETADRIYSCGWENVNNQAMRKVLIMMIARAQVPTQIVAFNMVNFDMELFATILQNSYSLFTLMKS